MSSIAFPADALRQAILSSLPEQSAQSGTEPPNPRFLYAPLSHARAIDPDTMLVEGNRGAGKSLWWSALLSEDHRRVVAGTLPKARLTSSMSVSAGFGTGLPTRQSPSKDVLADLLRDVEPRQIWRTVIGKQLLEGSSNLPGNTWRERVTWVSSNPEEFETAVDDAGEKLLQAGQIRLFVFDALDTAADSWEDLRRLLRGLLQVALEFRSRRGIRVKVFVRPDMLQDAAVTAFPDASKLTGTKASLSWARADLYGLLWQHLGNAQDGGDVFRRETQALGRQDWEKIEDTWAVPMALRTDEGLQRRVFEAIAGPWMGPNPKRGICYTWLPNHLADSFGQASPRSFQVALRAAANHQPPTDWPYALHHEGIRRGVQEASRIRVQEITEDYPWVSPAMESLRGQVTIPCLSSDLHSRWTQTGALDEVRQAARTSNKLGPRRIERGFDGLIQDLTDLGILQPLPDGRLQMPDVYRVAFGLGRKGGVKPLR